MLPPYLKEIPLGLWSFPGYIENMDISYWPKNRCIRFKKITIVDEALLIMAGAKIQPRKREA